MFESGFLLGAPPSRNRIISRISLSDLIGFELGYAAATSQELNPEQFSEGFSAVDDVPGGEFSIVDENAADLVHSMRAGRTAAFRHHVLQAYENQCCICAGSLVDLHGVYETEAAHIVPKRVSGADDIRNGLALCRKHHWAFDRGMFCIDENYHVAVPEQVLHIDENSSLGHYNGSSIRCPDNSDLAPHQDALTWHKENIFNKIMEAL